MLTVGVRRKVAKNRCIPFLYITIETLVVCGVLHGFYNEWQVL